jgi:hypothetical protein
MLEGMSEDGPNVGDVSLSLMWSAMDVKQKIIGLLVGVETFFPTGDHQRLLGEGGMSVEPVVSLAFQIFGSRLGLNLAYRIRPEHVSYVDGHRFEQDDELVWRAGLRIPRKRDVAWSIEAEGAIGMATTQGVWPDSSARPVWIGGGVDFPTGRLYRLGILVGFGVVGDASPLFTFGLSFRMGPMMPDEDNDGLSGIRDECPLLQEDHDDFKDSDGCPDLDNDEDGFPDDEDRCPLQPGDDFSEDGCP